MNAIAMMAYRFVTVPVIFSGFRKSPENRTYYRREVEMFLFFRPDCFEIPGWSDAEHVFESVHESRY